ncbi:hypothetical protein BT96DRAFT_946621 [Gymnopus androsaceus JB14]|uniref:Malonyl-CoA:ACP transacylase (MAT) domain-containing protein n=1 Tax=Gymnopus androsaceus JB14 TaxID=1447944 RepID=A0A6A4GWG3_9AGAR|nr:hypothetical protein BT96DRAFT_946621 [Gymnopus androsaceus JB14]
MELFSAAETRNHNHFTIQVFRKKYGEDAVFTVHFYGDRKTELFRTARFKKDFRFYKPRLAGVVTPAIDGKGTQVKKQGSKNRQKHKELEREDCSWLQAQRALFDFIHTTLGMDLDFILPFAGIPENGREIDGIGNKSELVVPGKVVKVKGHVYCDGKLVVKSKVLFKDQVSFCELLVTGNIFIQDQLNNFHKVGSVDFQADDAHGNPIVSYLQRHGVVQGLTVSLANEGYTLTSTEGSTSFSMLLTNEPYSGVLGNSNPIHINPYFSYYAGLPVLLPVDTFRTLLQRNIRNVYFRMMFPLSEWFFPERSLRSTYAILVKTVNSSGEKILEGSVEVSQTTTSYVFNGQGLQEPGMGMDLYNTSPTARAVWDGADEHCRVVYGFSIIKNVKDNPKDKTIHFSGIKGQAICQCYMEMSYDTDKERAHIVIRTPKYTFNHRNGVLFAQIALVVTEKVAFEDMRAKGFVQTNCAFAGHSLGEYSALASITNVLAISALVDIVFYRGITMQRAVERDLENCSNYAISQELFWRLLTNVEGQQYIFTGELVVLQTMMNVSRVKICSANVTTPKRASVV